MGVVETDSNTDDSNEELADEHTESTPDEEWATAEFLNSVERNWGGADVDQGEDERDQEFVADGTGGLQERGGVVEDEVDTSPLLHHLKGSTQDGTTQVRLLVPERACEAVGPARNPASRWDHLTLVLFVGNNFSKFDLDVFGIRGLSTESGESVGGSGEFSSLDEVAWGVGKEHQTDTKDESPSELDSNWNTVLTSVATILCGIDDARSQQDTNGDAELVTCDEGSTDFLWTL